MPINRFIYLIGCLGCFSANSIEFLLFSRFVQSFGGSTGSVLGQAICRDSFQGKRLGEVYASVGSALALSPAIGPILGGITDQFFGWKAIFKLLIFIGILVFSAVTWKLSETKSKTQVSLQLLSEICKTMFLDKKLLKFGLIIAACNGILFSYYAEGSFYLIELLGLSPSMYGFSFIALALAGILAGYSAKKMFCTRNSEQILTFGSSFLLLGCVIFVLLSFTFLMIESNLFAILATVSCMAIIQYGSGITLAVTLAKSLESYRQAIGLASALLGLFYYTVIALITLGIGMLHSMHYPTLPLCFFVIGVGIKALSVSIIKKQSVVQI